MYFWIEWRTQFLYDLIRAFPGSVSGKYLVNTSFDSGALSLSEEDAQNGWSRQGEYTYSPVLTDIQTFPYYQYDEWYVFECQTLLDNIEVFIIYWGFSLAYVVISLTLAMIKQAIAVHGSLMLKADFGNSWNELSLRAIWRKVIT